jgi:co-chaperonin GroES (HSP10)
VKALPRYTTMLSPDKIKPLKGWLLLEAAHEPEKKSGLYIPLEAQERYPQIAWVRAAGYGSSFEPNQLVVLPNEGFGVNEGSYTYWQVCYMILFDEGKSTKIQCDIEVWPIVREAVEGYRRKGENSWIRVKTVDGETLAFTPDEVLDYGVEEVNHPGYKIDYVPVQMIWLWEDGLRKLFYFIRESGALLVLENGNAKS